MFYYEKVLFTILLSVCYTNATDLIKELADKLNSINPSSNQKENTNINEWAPEIKQAAQSLIEQAKEYNVAHGLTKNDQSASGTDHDRVLCILKLHFAISFVLKLYDCLTPLGRSVDGVTTNDCNVMFWDTKSIVDPTLHAINIASYDAYFEQHPKVGANAVYSDYVVQKIHEHIASEHVDITDSVNAITIV
ncbi:hypothetical protein H4219_005804, partial [Mycoemilia scoparia]